MLEILSITAPIFILIALGYVCVMTRLISQDATRGMGVFVITIALPALIVRGMANKPLADSMDIDFLGGYALASLVLFALGLIAYRRLRHASLAESSMAGLGMSSANSGFIGVSICAMVLGTEPASRAVAMTILVESMVMIPLAMAIADSSGGQENTGLIKRLALTAKRLMRSPLLIAICLGLALSALRIPLPGVALRVIDMLAMAAAPVALFAVGGNLHGLRPRGMLGDATAISLAKLILHPALTALAFLLFPGLTPEMRQAGVLFAAAPMLSIYPILGMRYGIEARCSATLLLGTVLSFITISATIALIS
ncbi:AEC family transporter [Achromobacter sp. F4_2707]|uniref:AEC family transporter n=1 Tax=Achromobacter sp. F4_2707 TaxID=3114286 RepID=UPI0039C6A33C